MSWLRRKHKVNPWQAIEQGALRADTVYWLGTGLALAIIPHATHIPAWIIAIATAIVLWRMGLQYRHWIAPPRWLLGLLAVAAAGAVIGYFGTFFGRQPGVSALVLMMGLKFMETRNLRDAMLTSFLAYFVVISHFFFSQDIPFAIYMMLVVVVITAGLLGLSEGAVRTPVRAKLKTAGLLVAQSLPIMLVLFFLFPRLSAPLWGIPQDSAAARTGLSDQMEPGGISDLIRSDAVAFRVTFDDAPPPKPERYWRGPVLWEFNGRSWRMPQTPLAGVASLRTIGAPVNYTVTLEPHNKPWLLALDLPVSSSADAHLSHDHQLLANKAINELTQYRVRSQPHYLLGEHLSARELRLGLSLPPSTAPRTQTLARQWRDSLPNDPAIVATALRYFNEQPFVYTLSPGRLRSEPVDAFLFDTRQGFCEHYASAFVVLMRAAGIPARVVTGYLGGEVNPMGDYLIVRQSDAHAWAEVWLSGRGWVRVDPTAAVAPERIEQGLSNALAENAELPAFLRMRHSGSWLSHVQLGWDTINYHWNEWVLAYGPQKQQTLLERLGLGAFGLRGMIIAMMLAIGVILSFYTALYAWRNRRPRPAPIVTLYTDFCRRLARMGLKRGAQEGPQDFAQRAIQHAPALSAPINAITQAYITTRYNNAQEPDLRLLRQQLRHLHR